MMKRKHEATTASAFEISTAASTLCVVFLSLVARFVAWFYLHNFFELSPQFSAPFNSFRRFKEGIFLESHGGIDVYDNDIFHMTPIFLFIFKHGVQSNFLLRIEWTVIDFVAALLASRFVYAYIIENCTDNDKIEKAEKFQNLAFISYLLNPMTIGCWTVLSFSSVSNLLIYAFLYSLIGGNYVISILTLSLAAQINIYYSILVVVMLIRFKKSILTVSALSFFTFATLNSINLLAVKNPKTFFSNTLLFFLNVTDYTPNVGLFWYFFAQIFEHYRALFLFAFQFNLIIYVLPLTISFRRNVYILSLSLLILTAIFSSYPSYAETALYLPLLLAFSELHRYVRYGLIMAGTLVVSVVLTPIMWRMWVITGTGNANFFFAIVWTYNLGQIFIFADLASAYLRSTMIQEFKVKNIDEVQSIKLIDPGLF